MGKKYYIRNLEAFLDRTTTSTDLVVHKEQNVIELENDHDKDKFVGLIQAKDFSKDIDIMQYLNENLPQLAKKIKVTPIKVIELRNALEEIFPHLPGELFEQESIVDILKRVIDFIIKKNETEFLIINITNGRLSYDSNYRYHKQYGFYFYMVKLNHDAETLYSILCRIQSVIQHFIIKDILFSNQKIGRGELNFFNQSINLAGQNLADFKQNLEKAEIQIKETDLWFKRTTVKPPIDYEEEKRTTHSTSEKIISDINQKIVELQKAKIIIAEKIQENKGYLTLSNAKSAYNFLADIFRLPKIPEIESRKL